MTIATMLSLGETALKLGLICSLTVLALFLSYSMLNVCDLSTDGCFTFGAAVGAVVAVSGHPFLSIVAAMAAGIISGFVMAVTLSLDDYFVATYTKPATFDTISTYVVNATKGSQTNIRTALWALSTIIFLIVVIVEVVMNFAPIKNEAQKEKH